MYFFETMERLHGAGEGTGLKRAGRDMGPAIPAADRALESGSAEHLRKLLNELVQKGTQEGFKDAIAKKDFSRDGIEAGRAYVKAYAEYVHYVAPLYEAAQSPVHGHFHEPEEAIMHEAEN